MFWLKVATTVSCLVMASSHYCCYQWEEVGHNDHRLFYPPFTSTAMAGLKDLLQVLPPYAHLSHTSSSLLALWFMQKLHLDNMFMVKLDRKMVL